MVFYAKIVHGASATYENKRFVQTTPKDLCSDHSLLTSLKPPGRVKS
jgi:hypothetical protein